ncbi:uncharacterized protein BDW70DRAFT_136797 [Aspergillus foveolatus]|uniref:uncharacterized protein n=1 Tax=Aspergillus foveolatus TaxID=210207 RepID=UPI003CCD8F44
MESRNPKDHSKHDNSDDLSPETSDALQHRISQLSLSNPYIESSGPGESKQSDQPQPGEQAQEGASTSKGGSSVAHKISSRRADSDKPDSDEQGEEDSDIEPEELLKTILTIDMPREVEVRAKIKGDFIVRIFA